MRNTCEKTLPFKLIYVAETYFKFKLVSLP